MKDASEYHGFCFSQPGRELEITTLVEDDFALFLSAYARSNDFKSIVIDVNTRAHMRHGVQQLIDEGFKVVVMSDYYSPAVHDKDLGLKMLPLDVARSWPQLGKTHPRAVITSAEFIERFVNARLMSTIKAHFIPGTTDRAVKIAGRSGWYPSSSSVNIVEGKEIVNHRFYRYSVDRDYELTRKK